MKKLFFAFALTSALFSCKKETSTPNNSGNTTSDTTKTSNDVSISGFDCDGVKIAGTITKDKIASNVTATLTYTGGNGKTYSSKSYTSTVVSGLTATLQAGTLTNGTGILTYFISGTPTTAGKATFAIDFGGKTCLIGVNVEEVAQSSGINFNSIGTPIGSFQNNVSDLEGNSYKTVKIGTQVWMAENLKVSKYNDGTSIPNITDKTQWSNSTTAAWCYYNNDATNNSKYGKLYNWYAVSPTTNGNKNVCPTGWHVPTDAEWTVLTDYLGGESFAGGKMKEIGTINWNSPNADATNESLFTGLPGGFRNNDGYGYVGGYGNWWRSAEINAVNAWSFVLNSSSSTTGKGINIKRNGLSIRCLKD